jgi:ribosomal protein S12 methylthiotransferase
MDDSIPPDVKNERRSKLMEAQRDVSAARCAAQVGKTIEVMIDGFGEEGLVGRTQFEAPEVDGVVFLPEFETVPGDRFDVTVTDATEYDLVAE